MHLRPLGMKQELLAAHKTSACEFLTLRCGGTNWFKRALPLRQHLWLLAIHFICCLLLGPCPRHLAGIPSQDLPTTDGVLREWGWGKESSTPLPASPFAMDWWTSHLLQGNKLETSSGIRGSWTTSTSQLRQDICVYSPSSSSCWVDRVMPSKLLAPCPKDGVWQVGS